MAKRVAENQITKDDDDDDIEEVGSGSFRMADEKVIATRQLKGLPKRRGLGAPSDSPQAAAPGPSVKKPGFAGFGGFGASSSFSFSAPAPSSAVPSSLSSSTSSTSASSGKPTSSALFPSSSSPFGGSATPAAAPPKQTAPTPQSQAEDTKALEYYKSLRGLNTSLVALIQNATEQDAFADLGKILNGALDSYNKHRTKIQTDFDGKKEAAPIAPASIPPAASVSAPPSAPSVPSFPTFAPPTGGFAFGGQIVSAPAPTTTTSTLTLPPFVPPGASTGTIVTSKSDKEAGRPKSTAEAPKFSFSLFGQPSSAPPVTPTETAPSSPLVPPPTPHKPGPSSSTLPFSLTPSVTTPTESSETPDNAGAKPALSFGQLKNPFTSVPPSSTPTPSPFGNPTGASTTSSSLFGSSSTTSPFGFSSAPSAGASPFGMPPANKDNATTTPNRASFSFSKPSAAPIGFGSAFGTTGFAKTSPGSLGNPVGFSFGSPPKDTSATPAATATSSFPQPSFFSQPSTSSNDASAGEAREGSPEPGVRGDAEGEGEEDEEVVHSVKCKVHKLTTKRDGEKEWSDMGVGYLKVKKNKLTGKYRLLCRSEASARVTINFALFSTFSSSIDKKTLVFLGFEGTEPTPFRCRTSTLDQVQGMKQKIDEVIASL